MDINALELCEKQEKEIKELINSIDGKRRKNQEFQRMKYFERRRNNSPIKKTRMKKTKRKYWRKKNLCKISIWFAKRTFRINKIPFSYNQKMEKYFYKKYRAGGKFFFINFFNEDDLKIMQTFNFVLPENYALTNENFFSLIKIEKATPLPIFGFIRILIEKLEIHEIFNTSTIFYRKFESLFYANKLDKFMRTPVGKRKNFLRDPREIFILPEKKIYDVFFCTTDNYKDQLMRGSFLHVGDEVVGVIVYSTFSFMRGYSVSVVNLYKSIGKQEILCKNIKNNIMHRIKKIT